MKIGDSDDEFELGFLAGVLVTTIVVTVVLVFFFSVEAFLKYFY